MHDTKMKVLVVDDFSSVRSLIRTILKDIGFQRIEEAQDGAQALVKLRSGGFGFLVSDWNMPNMSGLELVTAIRKDPSLQALPVLMVTAEGEKENVLAALRAGVNSYVVKPFTADVLKEKMNGLFPAK